MKVWTVTYEDGNGEGAIPLNKSFRSQEAAEQHVREYMRETWEDDESADPTLEDRTKQWLTQPNQKVLYCPWSEETWTIQETELV